MALHWVCNGRQAVIGIARTMKRVILASADGRLTRERIYAYYARKACMRVAGNEVACHDGRMT